MGVIMASFIRWLSGNAANLLFTAALAAVCTGLWWERPSLALILPGTLVLGLLVYDRIRGGGDDDA